MVFTFLFGITSHLGFFFFGHDIPNLSYPTRDGTRAPAVEALSLWASQGSPNTTLLKRNQSSLEKWLIPELN